MVLMNETTITEYIRNSFENVVAVVAGPGDGSPEIAWGDTFFFYEPMGTEQLDRRHPFATIVIKDYPGSDDASHLDREGVFRLSIGVGRQRFAVMFGDGIGEHDFTALDRFFPHPIYGAMGWVCILNPSPETFQKVRPLLQEAYDRAMQRHKDAHPNE
jgi:Family of unknown function (DUF6194)